MIEHVYTAEFASGFRAELTISPTAASCAWTPELPHALRGQRRRRFLRSYRAWRDECLADYARRAGVNVLAVELT